MSATFCQPAVYEPCMNQYSNQVMKGSIVKYSLYFNHNYCVDDMGNDTLSPLISFNLNLEKTGSFEIPLLENPISV